MYIKFKSVSLLLNFFMNSASDAVLVLLIAHKHHYNETHFIFCTFVTMS